MHRAGPEAATTGRLDPRIPAVTRGTAGLGGARHSPRATGGGPQRVLIYEPPSLGCENMVEVLTDQGCEVLRCSAGRALLEEVVKHPPAAVVYGIPPDGARELSVLRLIRQAAPGVPLVLVSARESLVTQKLVQELRPIYYAICPVEAAELREAVQAALARDRRTARRT